MKNKQYFRIALYFSVTDSADIAADIAAARLLSGISHLNLNDSTDVFHLIPTSGNTKFNETYSKVLLSLPGNKIVYFNDTFKGNRFSAGQALAKRLAEDRENSLAVFLDLDKYEMFQNDEKILRKYGVEILKIK